MNDEEIMRKCIEEAIKGVKNGEGGPFGAAIVKDHEIIALGHNTVIKDNDPTAHGEVNVIRAACEKLGTFQLDDCIIYTSAEPCPMCLSAIMWAGIKKVYFGCSAEDTEKIGFADKFIYDFLRNEKPINGLEVIPLLREESLKAFNVWSGKTDKIDYDPRGI
ncbi:MULTISPECIES: nucleoside deaminase [Clostridium]|uniref:Nucleoside deaminase n=1 Tax=Clostridium cibarium TaxID=2762247 RepID=A0ABR8PQT2_9CLOT|nr:nucleoside deaminase [Clostridium sp. HBUAS56017]MBD7910531.1 nucleoside deaminase [Clostridium cibarium]